MLSKLEISSNSLRQQLWHNMKVKLSFINENGKYDVELFQIEKLCNINKLFNIIPNEWREIYGAIYDESHHFVVEREEEIKINKDVHRTFGLFERNFAKICSTLKKNHSQYCKGLFRVLIACSHEISYCQGVNFIAAAFILNEGDEKQSFTILSFLLRQRHLGILLDSKCSSLAEYIKVFEKKLRKFNKPMYLLLKTLGFDPCCFAVEWFTTCFTVSCPGELSFCVIDLLLVGIDNIMIRVGLAIVDMLSPLISRNMSIEDFQNLFKNNTRKLEAKDVIFRALSIQIDNNDILQVISLSYPFHLIHDTLHCRRWH
jgi:hypothetical protein